MCQFRHITNPDQKMSWMGIVSRVMWGLKEAPDTAPTAVVSARKGPRIRRFVEISLLVWVARKTKARVS